MNIIKNRNIFFTISGILVAAAIAAVAIWGLSFGIDFTGGSIMEVSYEAQAPTIEELEGAVGQLDLATFSVRPTGETGFIIRTPFLEEGQREILFNSLSFEDAGVVTEERFSSIGPIIGNELRTKALWGLGLVIIGIILFIAFAFRKVSAPVSSWRYGGVAIIALVHDIAIPTGAFALLGALGSAQVDVLFVMALLAILGYSVNDTIVVFDRVRENLRNNQDLNKHEPFEETVGRSLEQTYTRSINTSVTTLLVLLSLYFLGGASTQLFSLVLIIGVLSGTYSSIFLASPLLVAIQKLQEKK